MSAARFGRGHAVAIIDIGSNSGRVAVYTLDDAGQLRLLAGTRAALRLVADVDSHRSRTLGNQAGARLMEALRDFRALAHGAGARQILALGTSAMRDAMDGTDFLRRVRRELGFTIQVIDGQHEARLGLLGAVHSLNVSNGLLFDLGGGSLQLARFRKRWPGRAVSLPLGALRISRAFLHGDPPEDAEVRRLRRHVRRLLEQAGIGPLPAGAALVGTGGTVRNLAKIDRWARAYPITRVHGYVLSRRHLGEIALDLAARRQKKRDAVLGLSDERADSIVGGAFAIETLMDVCAVRNVHVSGQGVREGLAYSLLADELPDVARVRETSLVSLTARFAGWTPAAAARRAALAAALFEAQPERGGAEFKSALVLAARLLDVGRSVDFFERHEHAADIVLATDMDAFTHRELALVSAILRSAGDADNDIMLLRPLLAEDDRSAIERAAVLLVLADDIAERCRPGVRVALRCRAQRDAFVVSTPALSFWRPRGLARRFERAFGRSLVVRHGTA
jgi:exopolyphosphatase / guanosine-5'-triphosphate,3'-diphosphate pyrophosphatase